MRDTSFGFEDARGFPVSERIVAGARVRGGRSLLALGALVSVLLSVALGHGLALGTGGSASPPAAGVRDARGAGSQSLSASARASLSDAIGREDRAYWFHTQAAGVVFASSGTGLGAQFDTRGAQLRSHGLEVGLRLQALGYGSSLQPLPAARPQATATRVTYSRPGVTEWYANGPLGLEQGFTLERLPKHSATALLSLAVAVSGGASVALDRGARHITLARPGHAGLSYGGLTVLDASGRTLPSRLRVEHGTILLQLDTSGARLPIQVDPTVEEEAEAVPTEEAEGNHSGISVALSGDGSTALVGAPYATPSGEVFVFAHTASGEWISQGPPLSVAQTSGAQEARFGKSLALSHDGSTALIGGPHSDEGQGAAWVFTRRESGWEMVQKLTVPANSAPDRFGRSVALSGDGSTALVGAPADSNERGSAWTFSYSGSTWSVQQQLTGSEEIGAGAFGRSVALSSNGQVALVGGPADAATKGAAWGFTRTGASWSETKLTGAGESAQARFGYSVALSGDGTTALIGAPYDGSEDQGAAATFTHTETTWTEQAPKLAIGEADALFGYAVALSGDGAHALIGAPRAQVPNGAAWTYTRRSDNAWGEADRLSEPAQGGYGRFGASVSLSEDGLTSLVGAPGEQSKAGAAWVFTPTRSVEGLSSSPVVEAIDPRVGSTAGGTTVTITGAGFAAGASVAFGSHAATSVTYSSPTSITAVSPAGSGAVDVTVTTAHGTSARKPRTASNTSQGSPRSRSHRVRAAPAPVARAGSLQARWASARRPAVCSPLARRAVARSRCAAARSPSSATTGWCSRCSASAPAGAPGRCD